MQMSIKNTLKSASNAPTSGVLGKGWISLRAAFGVFWKRKLLVIFMFIALCIAFSGYFYFKNLRTASTILSLDYEEASKGLTPSQTRFNIFEIQSEDVMERLIAYAGLQTEIKPDELSKCINVKATHNSSVSGKENFISTSYTIEFTNNGLIQKRSSETMLSLLGKAYREHFVEHYGLNHSILSFDINDLAINNEYLTLVDLLELKCNQLVKYVQLRKRENKNYQDPDKGITFSALEQRLNNFNSYDLTRLRSYVIENGIANDKESLGNTLDYRIRMDRLLYDKFMAAYEEDNKGIQMYDVAMSAIVMIPTEDSSLKYYMSRTKTGVDNMALHADGQLMGATEKLDAIDYNTFLINKLKTNSPSIAQRNKADDMIYRMKTKLEEIAKEIQRVDSAFIGYKARNFLSFRNANKRFIDRIELVNSIFGAAVVFGVMFTTAFLYYFFRKRGKTA